MTSTYIMIVSKKQSFMHSRFDRNRYVIFCEKICESASKMQYHHFFKTASFTKYVLQWDQKIFKLPPYSYLVSKELNHFGVIADLFRQIGGHISRFVLFCSFWRLFAIKMIKSVKVFPFSFWKIIYIFFYFIKFKPPA